jgi:cytochrome oxidase Cu insertion factor (SCO1/SenC/PrrC family)
VRRGAGRLAVVALAAALAGGPAGAHEPDAAGETGYAPRFEPPPAGSYELPPIRRVEERELLGAAGRPEPLLARRPGRVTFVGFVYLSCPDACPASTATLQRLAREVEADAELRGRVRIVTVSFDPQRDDPARMARLGESLGAPPAWRFLTAADPAALRPVLEDFGQDVVAVAEEDGEASGVLRHVLKIFLVDSRGDVRNVYSTGLLDARLLVNDALTVLRAEALASAEGAGLR